MAPLLVQESTLHDTCINLCPGAAIWRGVSPWFSKQLAQNRPTEAVNNKAQRGVTSCSTISYFQRLRKNTTTIIINNNNNNNKPRWHHYHRDTITTTTTPPPPRRQQRHHHDRHQQHQHHHSWRTWGGAPAKQLPPKFCNSLQCTRDQATRKLWDLMVWILFLSGGDGRQTFLQGTPVADGEAKPQSMWLCGKKPGFCRCIGVWVFSQCWFLQGKVIKGGTMEVTLLWSFKVKSTQIPHFAVSWCTVASLGLTSFAKILCFSLTHLNTVLIHILKYNISHKE